MVNLKLKFSVLGFVALLTCASMTYGQKQAPVPTSSDVKVINTPTVVVGNSINSPIPVRNTERELYQIGGVVSGQCVSGTIFIAERTFPIPQGKRFVIEHASFRNWIGVLSPGDGIWVEVITTFNGQVRGRFLDFNRQQMGSLEVFVANHPLLAYADGGTDVTVKAVVTIPPSCAAGSTNIATGVLNGYLVDMP